MTKNFTETSKTYCDEIWRVCKKLKDTNSKSHKIKNLVYINDSLCVYQMELKNLMYINNSSDFYNKTLWLKYLTNLSLFTGF